MRGTLRLPAVGAKQQRIIPAHAGNTPRRPGRPTGRPDHPRACGEHGGGHGRLFLQVGSSPRMRGTHQAAGYGDQVVRIIPAHAGNTPPVTIRSTRLEDHPRACGEHASGLAPASTPVGSSPRMRGTHSRPRPRPGSPRIIPAHAGNTQRSTSPACRPADHPRACGEHTDRRTNYKSRPGSSPRMRGTQRGTGRRCRCYRIIPAHAGNTEAAWASLAARSDHPRACGEHSGSARK